MLKKDTRFYYLYMTTSLVAFLIFGGYYFLGLACGTAVLTEAIIATISIILGFTALREYRRGSNNYTHWLAIVFLLPLLPVVPAKMIATWGFDPFLQNRLIAAVTLEVLAITQIILAINMLKGAYQKTTGR